MNRGYFDVELEVVEQYCAQCAKVTTHNKSNPKATLTCRAPNHRHPTKEEQEQTYTYAKKEGSNGFTK